MKILRMPQCSLLKAAGTDHLFKKGQSSEGLGGLLRLSLSEVPEKFNLNIACPGTGEHPDLSHWNSTQRCRCQCGTSSAKALRSRAGAPGCHFNLAKPQLMSLRASQRVRRGEPESTVAISISPMICTVTVTSSAQAASNKLSIGVFRRYDMPREPSA